jgi:cysteine desulfurase
VSFCFHFIEGESILLHLDLLGIAVPTVSSCASHKLEPSHVLTAIGVSPQDSHGTIRTTLSRYNGEEDADYVLEVLPEVVENLRKMSPLRGGQNLSQEW